VHVCKHNVRWLALCLSLRHSRKMRGRCGCKSSAGASERAGRVARGGSAGALARSPRKSGRDALAPCRQQTQTKRAPLRTTVCPSPLYTQLDR